MRPSTLRPIALVTVALFALSGCAGKKDPTADGLTTTSGLGTFGPSSPAGTAPGGFGDGSGTGTGIPAPVVPGPAYGAVDGSTDLLAGGTVGTGTINGSTLDGVYVDGGTTTGGFIDGGTTSGGFIDGGVITQADPTFYDPAGGLGTTQQAYDSTLFDATTPIGSGGVNDGRQYETYSAAQGGQGALSGYTFPGDDGRPTYFNTQVGNRVLFATDSSQLSEGARETLRRQSAWLQLHPEHSVTLEGHADERGTREYNLALGARRADAARNYMVALGVSAQRLRTVSFGKERPVAVGGNPNDWAKNRRVETVLRGGASF